VLTALPLLLAASPAQALTLAAAAATDFDATVAADNLGQPTDVAELPDGRIVVIEKGGNVKTFTPGVDDPAVDKITVENGNNERGLLGIVADPDFATNHFLYFYASQGNDANNRHHVLRYTLGADGKLGNVKTVIDMGLMGPANHDGGGLSIYGGNLFVSVGDTGNNSSIPPHNHFGSCLNHANGKVLRVSLAEATLGQPPADNPLVGLAMVTGCDDTSAGDNAAFVMRAPEKRIYAWGFRNPFRNWADPMTGKVWVGDVGETTREEIDVVEKGKHYGFPFYEGTKDWRSKQTFVPQGDCMGMTPAAPCVAPQTDYGDDGPTGGGAPQEAVMGGRILDGCGWPAAWKSRYIFGDHVLNKIWTVDVNATRDGVVANSRKDFATSNGVTAMRMGTDNALYIVEYGSNRVTRITAKAAPAATPGSCLTTNPAPTSGAGGSGAGGAAVGGAAAGGASAGGQAAGGTGTTAGTSTGGTAAPTGGTATGTGGTSSTTAGTSSTTAGTSSTTAGTTGSNSDSGDSGGCGCSVAGGHGTALLSLAALASALGLVFGRRRNRRS
jgi:glucose/arabinose dehydrogenase